MQFLPFLIWCNNFFFDINFFHNCIVSLIIFTAINYVVSVITLWVCRKYIMILKDRKHIVEESSLFKILVSSIIGPVCLSPTFFLAYVFGHACTFVTVMFTYDLPIYICLWKTLVQCPCAIEKDVGCLINVVTEIYD